ncbi:hypothetical protein [Bordetella genomosp. 4]|uniref:Uncharacterized protein n=1 Tax=Bordetella genomosp. 4 TaxID=463044 RepID=A0A261U3N0_9BORD|nr:hypothetical protein [Bordetella genomosp. 4]OZI56087.1 hypothetical protein CAL20_11605 [Bordetella genomosp. 4]
MTPLSQSEWSGAPPPREARGGALRMARWLHLAAAPAFAAMAAMTFLLGGDAHPMTCLGGDRGSPISGMGLMYLLMSVFHAAPWLKFVASRR